MEIKILQEKNNPLLKRKEVILEVDHLGKPTPSRESLTSELIKFFNVEKDRIEIDYILSQRGYSKARVKVKIYEMPIKNKSEKNETQTSSNK